MKRFLLIVTFLCTLSLFVDVKAQKLPFQGRLLQNQQPVNDTLSMVFSIDTLSWSETHSSVIVSEGLYDVILGSLSALPGNMFEGFSEHQLNISVGGTVLTPVNIYPAISNSGGSVNLIDSVSINDRNGRQGLVLESWYSGAPTAFIGGYGPNGKANFFLSSQGHNRSYGNLHLKDSVGITKAWISAYSLPDGRASGLVSLYGPDNKGWVGAGFKNWQTDSLSNHPYIHLEGNIPNIPLVNAEVNETSGKEWGQIMLKNSADNMNSTLSYNGLYFHGPSKQVMSLGQQNWGNADLGFIHLYDTAFGTTVEIQTNIDGDGNSHGDIRVKTSQNNTHFSITSNELFHHGPNTPNIQMGGKPWESMDLAHIGLFGSISDGAGWFFTGASIDVNKDGYGKQWGNIALEKIDSATTTRVNTVELSGDLWGSNGGGLILKNDTANMIELHGGNGTGYFKGSVYVENGTYVTSDKRFKSQISTLENALTNINSIRGVSYILNENPKKGNQIGVIAQEVEEVYPELVNTDSDGYKSVNYAQMVAVLIEAVKELNLKIENLQNQNNQLTQENNTLKAQLEEQMNSLNSRLDQLEKLMSGSTIKASAGNSVNGSGK